MATRQTITKPKANVSFGPTEQQLATAFAESGDTLKPNSTFQQTFGNLGDISQLPQDTMWQLAVESASQDMADKKGMTDEDMSARIDQYFNQLTGNKEASTEYRKSHGFNPHPIQSFLGGLGDGIDYMNSEILGRGLDLAFDNTIGNLSGFLMGDDAGEAVKNAFDNNDVGNVLDVAEDIGISLIPGAGIPAVLAKNLSQNVDEIGELFSGKDQVTGADLSENQLAGQAGSVLLDSILSAAPGVGKLAKVGKAATKFDEAAPIADDVVSKISSELKPSKLKTAKAAAGKDAKAITEAQSNLETQLAEAIDKAQLSDGSGGPLSFIKNVIGGKQAGARDLDISNYAKGQLDDAIANSKLKVPLPAPTAPASIANKIDDAVMGARNKLPFYSKASKGTAEKATKADTTGLTPKEVRQVAKEEKALAKETKKAQKAEGMGYGPLGQAGQFAGTTALGGLSGIMNTMAESGGDLGQSAMDMGYTLARNPIQALMMAAPGARKLTRGRINPTGALAANRGQMVSDNAQELMNAGSTMTDEQLLKLLTDVLANDKSAQVNSDTDGYMQGPWG